MKKSVGAVARIIAVFTVFSFFFSLAGCFSARNVQIDTTGAYGDVKSQFRRGGMKGIWISYIEFQSVDFSTQSRFIQCMGI